MIRSIPFVVAASVIAASCSGGSEVLPTSTEQVVSTTTTQMTAGSPSQTPTTTSRITPSTTLPPCSESVVVGLSSSSTVKRAATPIAEDLLLRNLSVSELEQIVRDVHEIEREVAVTGCEIERGNVREYIKRDWREELPELITRRHQSEVNEVAQSKAFLELACWNNPNPSPLLGCE